MPKRLTPKQYERIRRRLKERDGPYCRSCGVVEAELDGPLTIDHIDEDRDNWSEANLELLCRPCNTRKSDRLRPRRARKVAGVSGDLWGGEGEGKGVRGRKLAFDATNGSPELQANSMYEPLFRQWLLNLVGFQGAVLVMDALDGGSEFVGCSPNTAVRYLRKITSITGPLRKTTDEMGIPIVVLRAADE